MRLNFTLRQVVRITQGQLVGGDLDEKISSFVTDSRMVTPGDAFIALQGAKYDARQFIPQVLEKGARVIIAQAEGYQVPAQAKAAFVLVKNPLLALQELAKYHRLHSHLKVAAITGSNGKSTTKQMLLSICQTAGETVANVGNFNNQFGVPFSLLEIQPKHRFGVFELGASHPGDIQETARLAVPDVAVITNVSAAHLEFFNDLETVYKTKTEIAACLNKGGVLVYNTDNEYLHRLDSEFTGNKIAFGFSATADVHVLETDDFSFTYKGQAYRINKQLERHDKLNAAAAVAAAFALNIPFENIQKGLLAFTPMPMRLERVEKHGVHFILDCYNANPASMKTALEILSHQTATPRIAVLGDMKELGRASKEYHRAVAKQVIDSQVSEVFLAGPHMRYAHEVLKPSCGIKVHYAAKPEAWMNELKQALSKGGCCLIKASRSMQFENILKEI